MAQWDGPNDRSGATKRDPVALPPERSAGGTDLGRKETGPAMKSKITGDMSKWATDSDVNKRNL